MLAAAIALLSGAQWLRAWEVRYLVVAAGATVAATATSMLLPRAARRWALASGAAAAVFCVLAASAQRTLSRIAGDWPAYRAHELADGNSALAADLNRTARTLRSAATQALDAPADPAAAFTALARLVPRHAAWGVVLYRAGMPVAWAGHIVTSGAAPDSDARAAPLSAGFTPFYLTLSSATSRGGDRAVATAVVHARSPAEHFAMGLANRVATRVGLRDFRFASAGARDSLAGSFAFAVGADTLFRAQPVPLGAAETALLVESRARYHGGVAIAVALLLFLIAAWRRDSAPGWPVAPLAVVLLVLALVPLNAFSGATVLFDPTVYFASLGGAFSASAGALMLTGAVVLLALLMLLRARARVGWRPLAAVAAAAIIIGSPFLLRALSRGITPPPGGVSNTLWLAWEIALFLVAAALLVAASAAGSTALGMRRGAPPALAPVLAAVAAVAGPLVLRAPAHWPEWYQVLWVIAIGVLALTRRHQRLVFTAATVAALGATTLTWNAGVRGRIALANRDVAALDSIQPDVAQVLALLADSLQAGAPPTSEAALLQRYVQSDLEGTGYPVRMTSWTRDGRPAARLALASFEPPAPQMDRVVSEARASGTRVIQPVLGWPGTFLVLAVPFPGGEVTSVAVAPRTRLIAENPFNTLLGLSPHEMGTPPYRLSLTGATQAGLESRLQPGVTSWRRAAGELHGDRLIQTGAGPARAHIEVVLRSPAILVQRGLLVVLLDLLIVAALWIVSALPDGALTRWWRGRVGRWAASYRARLTVALFAFFVIPEIAFAFWSYQRLQSEDRESRELLLRGTLRAASRGTLPGAMEALGEQLGTPLLVYANGMLWQASEPLYAQLAPAGRWLPPSVYLTLRQSREVYTSRVARVGGDRMLFGYQPAVGPLGQEMVVAAPARGREEAMGQRRHDLGVLVLFATVIGAIAALWLSGMAARSLALPIGRLRGAALAIAAGEREPPLSGTPPEEFVPVFTAFRHMAADLGESRAALESAQRRTNAVLRNVASGVVAVTRDGTITLANPRAEALVGQSLPADASLDAVTTAELAGRVQEFLGRTTEEEEFEVVLGERQVQARLVRLASGGGGAVLTLDDLTELARAQRVLAWGEMARQVAHEIKNPLTPIRLGVQHLRRARADARVDFDRILEQNVQRILAEIDRLDEIARSFSRYGVAPVDRIPAGTLDVAAAVRDVVELERIGHDAVTWTVDGAEAPVDAVAREDELREVLLNVLENARLAEAGCVGVRVQRRAGRVVIEVRDDGCGIPAAVLPRIFEPHFSTRTRGSGLGLAISRRLVEGWGGAMGIASTEGAGTTVRIELREPDMTHDGSGSGEEPAASKV
ncbi:MAG TPA: ATP-binding protein [Gemmatimonadaceae bacterium]|nr:ATP-binding protein [Gemmatimonadaceae bacterium]